MVSAQVNLNKFATIRQRSMPDVLLLWDVFHRAYINEKIHFPTSNECLFDAEVIKNQTNEKTLMFCRTEIHETNIHSEFLRHSTFNF